MKKLDINELEIDDNFLIENHGIESAVYKTYVAARTIALAHNDLIDLVNSQQEAIEKLERVYGTQTIPDIVLPADDKPKDRYRLMLTTSYSGIVENRLFDTKEEAEAVIGLIHKAMRGDTHRTDKVSARDMASRNPSPEAKKALEAAVQQSQEDMNKMSTHRTVTLRIPKGMTFGWAMIMAYAKSYKHDDWVSFFEQSDTDLQKALDEVQPNE